MDASSAALQRRPQPLGQTPAILLPERFRAEFAPSVPGLMKWQAELSHGVCGRTDMLMNSPTTSKYGTRVDSSLLAWLTAPGDHPALALPLALRSPAPDRPGNFQKNLGPAHGVPPARRLLSQQREGRNRLFPFNRGADRTLCQAKSKPLKNPYGSAGHAEDLRTSRMTGNSPTATSAIAGKAARSHSPSEVSS